MDKYYPPIYKEEAFNCPYCGAYSDQNWINPSISMPQLPPLSNTRKGIGGLDIACCRHCGKYSIWYEEQMIYPDRGNAPMPNPDLPDDIKADYEEAASIANRSPKGAAALLRLAIEKLCKHLKAKGSDLDEYIGYFVKEKLITEQIQKALDIVRVIGNYAVHPGTIDLKDDIQTVESLFNLINIIAEHTITNQKHIDSMYEKLPDSKKDAIAKRDNKN